VNDSFNAAIRQAAGGVAPARTPDPERFGNLGIGCGSPGRLGPARPIDSTEINARIRQAARLARSLTVPSGVDLYVGDLHWLVR
jgi:hypothetical protein